MRRSFSAQLILDVQSPFSFGKLLLFRAMRSVLSFYICRHNALLIRRLRRHLLRWRRLSGALPSAVAVAGSLPVSRFFLWRQKAQRKKLGKKERPCKELSLAAASEEPPRLQRASFLKKA